jgi:DNA-binding IclR family transcriptional regulator
MVHTRLSAAELAVMNAVTALGQTGLDPIVQRTHLNVTTVQSALDLLARLGYLVATDREGTMVYLDADGQT